MRDDSQGQTQDSGAVFAIRLNMSAGCCRVMRVLRSAPVESEVPTSCFLGKRRADPIKGAATLIAVGRNKIWCCDASLAVPRIAQQHGFSLDYMLPPPYQAYADMIRLQVISDDTLKDKTICDRKGKGMSLAKLTRPYLRSYMCRSLEDRPSSPQPGRIIWMDHLNF
jgi:hypothetical protein